MPAGMYDDFTLIDVRPAALDEELRRLCAGFRARPAGLRNALTMDDFYLLLAFTRRAAVFAIRSGDRAWIEDGLTALAIVDEERIDPRDLYPSLSLLHHAANRIGADAGALVSAAAALATRSVAQRMRDFLQRPADEMDIRSWGQQEIATPLGAGFVNHDFGDYHPRRDLLPPALAIRALLERDRYRVEGVALGSSLPPVWFGSPEAESLVARVTGVATIHASAHSDREQIAMVFIAELSDAPTAERLVALAARATLENVAIAAVAHENLLCLLIGRSIVHGAPSIETNASLRRFVEPVRAALAAGDL
jgi:hypothetical protein